MSLPAELPENFEIPDVDRRELINKSMREIMILKAKHLLDLTRNWRLVLKAWHARSSDPATVLWLNDLILHEDEQEKRWLALVDSL